MKTLYQYSNKDLILVSSVEEFLVSGAFWIILPTSLVGLLTLRMAWAILHLPNEQVRRMFAQNKKEFGLNLAILGAMVPAYSLLWFWKLWPIALASHSGWNIMASWAKRRSMRREGFKLFWKRLEGGWIT